MFKREWWRLGNERGIPWFADGTKDQVMKLVAFLVQAELGTCISGAASCDEAAVLW
jgi:hypothetical protein